MSERESLFSPRESFLGHRANPHPSGELKYEVEVVKEDERGVTVRYLDGGLSWWITRQAWKSWEAQG